MKIATGAGMAVIILLAILVIYITTKPSLIVKQPSLLSLLNPSK